jgi:phytoene dehydrogenase-like protein
MATFDGLIVGGGHNGLTLGAYLARAGLRVAVLERTASIGGGTGTEEPALPGFRFNLHSNFYIGFGSSPLVRDLELARHGFATVEPPVQQGVALRDGTALTIHKDLERSCASLARFSKRDADAFRDLYQTYAVAMRPFFTSLLYNAPLPPAELRARLTGPQGQALLAHAPLDLFGAVDRHFEDHRVRTFFKLFMHVTTGENEPGTGLIFPTIMSAISHLALPVGGSGAFATALARAMEAAGGVVLTGADVREITVAGGRATGVRLADGRRLPATRFVASAIDAPGTMRLAGEEHFPDDVREKLRAWHWGHHSLVTLHLALTEPPAYASAAFDPDLARAFNVFLGFDDVAQVVRCFEQCRRGEFPDHPMGNGACNTLFDPSYAPPGRHVAFWWPFAPYALPDGPEGWDRRRREYTERLLEVWRAYAPNLTRDTVLATYLYTPLDLERRIVNMVRGAVRMGAYVPSQLGINRPHPLMAGNRTPIEGLYLCGSSCHGGGVNGAPGYNAANAIAADLGLRRPWTPVPPPEWAG